MIRQLHPYQIHDPQRGSFIIKDEPANKRLHGQLVYMAPCHTREGVAVPEPNALEFVVLRHSKL